MQQPMDNNGGITSAIASLFVDPTFEVQRINLISQARLFEPTDPAQHIYYINRGQIRLYQIADSGATRLISILGAGEWFGIAALAGGRAQGFRAIAVVPSIVAQMSVDRFLHAALQKPAATLELLRHLSNRVCTGEEIAGSLIFDDCNSRLIKTLLRFSQTAAATRTDQGIVLRVTHDQLAQAVGVARETVSLALTQLRQANALRTGRNQLTFQPDVLRSLTTQAVSKTLTTASASNGAEAH